jgi:predicted small lipoprotein YifL
VKHLKIRQSILAGAALAVVSTLAACGPKAPPQVALPPPPVVTIPPQPMPPRGASPNLVTPPINTYGVRQTVNTGISAAQTTWNLRSAYNVAALNCMQPQHAQIVVNYRAFLKAQVRKLTIVNKAVDDEFKAKFGPKFIAPRELYMTQVYNYFALPPIQPSFCDAALAMSIEAATVKSADLDSFAARSLPMLEQVFLRFYTSFDQYRVDLTAWQAKYTVPGSTPAPAPRPVVLQMPSTPAQAQAR